MTEHFNQVERRKRRDYLNHVSKCSLGCETSSTQQKKVMVYKKSPAPWSAQGGLPDPKDWVEAVRTLDKCQSVTIRQ